ncbi:hypothetical protein ACFQV4_28270 [Streptomyces thermocarboxydus]
MVTAVTDAAADRVAERAVTVAERLGLTEDAAPSRRPGPRTQATPRGAGRRRRAAARRRRSDRRPGGPLAASAAQPQGGHGTRHPAPREPRFRARVRERFGASGMELLLAAANAAAHGAAQSPVSLLLDGLLRAGQLTEATARAAAFEALHDDVCRERRTSVPPAPGIRPPLRVTPAQAYAANAGTGSVAGAAATLLVTHDAGEAAEAVLAGSPKAARYGPAAFNSVLGAELARTGVLVRAGPTAPAGDRRLARAARRRAAQPAPGRGRGARAVPRPGAPVGGGGARRGPAGRAARRRHRRLRAEGHHPPRRRDRPRRPAVRRRRPRPPAGRAHRRQRGPGARRRGPGRRGRAARGDVAIALTDGRSAVPWGADALAPPDSRTSGGCSPRFRRPAASAAARRPWPVRAPRSPGCWWPAAAPRRPRVAAAHPARPGERRRGGRPRHRLDRGRPRGPRRPARTPAARALARPRTARGAHPPAARPHRGRTGRTRPARRPRAAAGRTPGRDRSRRARPLDLEAAGAVRRELDDPLTPVLATGAVASALLGSWWTRCSWSARWTSTRSRAACSGCAPSGPSPGSPPASSPARAVISPTAARSPSTPRGCGRRPDRPRRRRRRTGGRAAGERRRARGRRVVAHR